MPTNKELAERAIALFSLIESDIPFDFEDLLEIMGDTDEEVALVVAALCGMLAGMSAKFSELIGEKDPHRYIKILALNVDKLESGDY